MRNKAADFIDSIIFEKYDICLVTETLLEDDDVKQTDATPSGYSFLHCPRSGRIGSGTGLVFRDYMKPKVLTAGNKRSFEFSEWLLIC